MTKPDREVIEEFKAAQEAATEGPWAWSQYGEKSNNFYVGIACDKDGQAVGGFVECESYDEDGQVFIEQVFYSESLGHMEDTRNYDDAKLICIARNSDIGNVAERLLADCSALRTELAELDEYAKAATAKATRHEADRNALAERVAELEAVVEPDANRPLHVPFREDCQCDTCQRIRVSNEKSKPQDPKTPRTQRRNRRWTLGQHELAWIFWSNISVARCVIGEMKKTANYR